MKLVTCHKVYLQLISVSVLRFQSSKDTEVKAHQSNLRLYTSNLSQSFPKIQKKFAKLQGERLSTI